MAKKNQYRVSLFVDGIDFGVWDKKSGGDVDSDELKYKEGGMGPTVALGGTPEVSNVVLTRLKKRGPERDDVRIRRQLRNYVGKGNAVCIEQPLDANGNAYGESDRYNGKVKRISGADVDSMSTDADTYEIEISTAGTVG